MAKLRVMEQSNICTNVSLLPHKKDIGNLLTFIVRFDPYCILRFPDTIITHEPKVET